MTFRHFRVEVGTPLRIQCGNPSIHLGCFSYLFRSMTTDKKRGVEALWRDLFSNTSQWWDHRPEKASLLRDWETNEKYIIHSCCKHLYMDFPIKINPRFPDFKHRQSGESLWLAGSQTPLWVQAELASIPPGTLQFNAFGWTQKLKRYVKAGQYRKTMEVFHKMQREGICPNTWTFLPVLNACAGLRDLEEGKHIHARIIELGCDSDVYVANCLVDMYAKCGSIGDAWNVFNQIQEHNVVSWNVMIGGYVKSGQGPKAMELFQKMLQEGVQPNAVTFVGVLNACASVVALEEGRRLHAQIIQRGCESDIVVANCLLDMYAKCGSMEDAWNVFKGMREHDVVSWNVVIRGYVKSGQGWKAVELSKKMQYAGVEPNTVTFVGVLNACASVVALEEGRHVHEQIIERGWESDIYVANCLVDMYAKCGSIEDACIVFNMMQEHNVVSWNAVIGGYLKSGEALKAMESFHEMQQEGVEPDSITFIGVLNACASVADLEEGRRVHGQIIQKGCMSHVYVSTCLVDMYAKCGSMDDAWIVFIKMGEHNVVSWNAMIGGYVKSGQGLKALELFQEMQQEGVEPDAVTFIGVLNACAIVAALEEGRCVHEQIIQKGWVSDVYVATGLVDMYSRCGSIQDAENLFDKMLMRNVVAWTAMIRGYAMHGHAKKAIGLFKQMAKEDVEIDGITFTCLLSACSHGGLVTEGLRYIKSMTSCYNVLPTIEHYGCMVDLLSRAGLVEEAVGMMKRMPVGENVFVWMSLLGACRVHGNVEIAEHAAKRCRELDAGNASGRLLMSNIYAAAGKWDRCAAIEEECSDRKVCIEHGRTWIEVNNVVHTFEIDVKEHHQRLEIHSELKRVSMQMNEAGYVPDARFLIDEGNNRFNLCHHSEMLATAYGLISTPLGTPLRIIKNWSVCPKCHDAIKFIANMVGRVITVKDANCFHRFEGGICSCKDYW